MEIENDKQKHFKSNSSRKIMNSHQFHIIILIVFISKSYFTKVISSTMTQNFMIKANPTLISLEKTRLHSVPKPQSSLAVSHLISDVARIKREHLNRKNKQKRASRYSQINNIQCLDSSILCLGDEEQPRQQEIKLYYSPACDKRQKLLTKSTSLAQLTNVLKAQTERINMNENIKQKQFVSSKSKNKFHKKSSISIQQTLKKHKILKDKVKNQTSKAKKISRFSENIYTQFNNQEITKQIQNHSRLQKKLNSVNKNQQAEFELKQTISTVSSHKATKSLNINDFDIGIDLGKGKFGRVVLVKHKETHALFSIKIINKETIRQQKLIQQLTKQIKLQSYLHYRSIVKLYSIFDDVNNIYLLLELGSEGNLYQFMQKNRKTSEEVTGKIMKDILDGVSEIHRHSIIHRDLKPENIVMNYGMAKICDFGWSTNMQDTMRETFCGTPLYVSPEILKGDLYNQKVDQWALGILTYEMLTGSIPFQIKSERDLRKIIETKIIYPKQLSSIAIDFLKQLLNRDPTKRRSLAELLPHPFLNP